MKYLFEKSDILMAQNGKNEKDFDNIINVALPRYGAVTPYVETAIMSTEEIFDNNTTGEIDANDGSMEFNISEATYNEAICAIELAQKRADTAEQELLLYAPVIEAVKSLSAIDKTMIDKLTAELAARDTADEKYERLNAALKALIE